MDASNIEISLGDIEKNMDFIMDLGRRTVEASISDQRPAPLIKAELSYLRMLDYAFAQKSVVFIAKADDGAVGFLIYADFLPEDVTGAEQGFIAYMAVEPHMRGKGIGKRLLAAAEDLARSRGTPAMALMVTERNTTARAVYEQAGYTTERRLLCKNL